METQNKQENLEERTNRESIAWQLFKFWTLNPRLYYGVGKFVASSLNGQDNLVMASYLGISAAAEFGAEMFGALPYVSTLKDIQKRENSPRLPFPEFIKEDEEKHRENESTHKLAKEMFKGPLPVEFFCLKLTYREAKIVYKSLRNKIQGDRK